MGNALDNAEVNFTAGDTSMGPVIEKLNALLDGMKTKTDENTQAEKTQGEEGEKSGKKQSDALAKVHQALAALRDGYNILHGVVSRVVGVFETLISKAMAKEESIQRLTNTLGLHGIAWDEASASIGNYISEVTRTEGLGGSVVRESLSQIAAITAGADISLETMERISSVARDVASTGIVSAEQIQTALARVAAGGGVGSLSRSMPFLAQELTRVTEAGGGLEEALAAIEDRFGGLASEIPDTALQINRMNTYWSGFQANLGLAITGPLSNTGILRQLTDQFEQITTDVSDANTSTGHFAREGLSQLVSIGGLAAQGVLMIAQGISGIVDVADWAVTRLRRNLAGAEVTSLRATRLEIYDAADREMADLHARMIELAEISEETGHLTREQSREYRVVQGDMEALQNQLTADIEANTAATNAALGTYEELDTSVSDILEGLETRQEGFSRAVSGLGDAVDSVTDSLDGTGSATLGIADDLAAVDVAVVESKREWNMLLDTIIDISALTGTISPPPLAPEMPEDKVNETRRLLEEQWAAEEQASQDHAQRMEELAREQADNIVAMNEKAGAQEEIAQDAVHLIWQRRITDFAALTNRIVAGYGRQREALMGQKELEDQVTRKHEEGAAAEQEAEKAGIEGSIGKAQAIGGSVMQILGIEGKKWIIDALAETGYSISSFAFGDVWGGVGHAASAAALTAAGIRAGAASESGGASEGVSAGGGGSSSRSGGGSVPIQPREIPQAANGGGYGGGMTININAPQVNPRKIAREIVDNVNELSRYNTGARFDRRVVGG
jgi:hypothetical protein